MRKIINGLVNMARHKAAPDVANAAMGAGLSYFAASIASRSFTGQEILAGA